MQSYFLNKKQNHSQAQITITKAHKNHEGVHSRSRKSLIETFNL